MSVSTSLNFPLSNSPRSFETHNNTFVRPFHFHFLLKKPFHDQCSPKTRLNKRDHNIMSNSSSKDINDVDIHANQQNDSERMDHPPELKEANHAAVKDLLSKTTTVAPTHVLNIMGTECTIELVTDSITHVKVDAIVNAANEMLEGGGGVDQAIHAVAGPSLYQYCVGLPYQMVESEGGAIHGGEMARCPVGEAISTPGFELPHAKYVIHTVAPLLHDDGQPRSALLEKCYLNCLRVASELDGVLQ